MSLSASILDNPAEINKKIQELENQRASLHNSTKSDEQDELSLKANELSNGLHLAIRNNDLETLNALIISSGELPSLIEARDLIVLKSNLEKERLNQIQYTDIQQQLNSNVLDFNYNNLRDIKAEIEALDSSSELNIKLQQQFITIVESFKSELEQKFKESSKSSKWLRTGVINQETEANFINLVNLQSLLRDESLPLWAFEAISSNFKVSFDYHFNSSQETNRIDKPELFFTYHLNYLDQHLSLINKVWSLNKTDLSHLSAHSEFIKASLVPIITKISGILQVIRENHEEKASTDILIHLINEILQYDHKLINGFYYDPNNDGKWAGLFQILQYDDLEKWLLREVQINLNNFESIVNSSNCFHIDYTSVGADDLKPTVSAVKLKILFENITKNFSKIFKPQYESLAQVNKFKLRFFSKVYLNLLNLYLTRLREGYAAFNDLFKSNRSIIKNSSSLLANGIDITGTNGLERIFRLYGSVKFISNSLNLWNQELIFSELNTLFNQFSTSLKTSSLFTSILKDFKSLEVKSWSLLESFINKTIKTLTKGYTSLNNWNEQTKDEPTISNELLPVTDVLNEYNLFISKILPRRQYQILQNHISSEIADLFFNSIIKSNHFNSSRIHQLSLDINTIWDKLLLNFDFPLYYKIIEALKVLSLTPIQASQFTNVTLSQYAKNGDYSDIREFLSLNNLRDNDILDILLRIH